MGATIGMAMFGAIIFIPLYLQLVYGVSATQSGLRMLPLMIGLLVAAISSGRAISRIGRYKIFPIAGTGTLVVGMFLLSRLGVGTAPWLASLYMLVVGVGIGLVMQVLVLVVQNDAQPENIGVATSTATFFRSMGGSFGVAIFGAIFAARLSAQLAQLPAQRRRAPRQRRPAEPGRGRPASRRPSTPTSCRPSRTRCTASSCGAWRSPSSPSRSRGSSRRCRCAPRWRRAGRAQRRGGRRRRRAAGGAHRGVATRRRAEPRTTTCARNDCSPPSSTLSSDFDMEAALHRRSSRCGPRSGRPSRRPRASAPVTFVQTTRAESGSSSTISKAASASNVISVPVISSRLVPPRSQSKRNSLRPLPSSRVIVRAPWPGASSLMG